MQKLLKCRKHGKTKHFQRKDASSYRCGKCASEAVTRHRQQRKAKLVKEHGGICVKCGYHKCVAALTFHHRDPSDKSFSLSGNGCPRSYEKMQKEALKCDLLCMNCHAEVHAESC